MAKNEAKIKFTAETGEFNKQIQSANNEMTELRAELRLNETQMKGTGTTIESLENKHKILSNQLKVAEDKTEALNQKVKKAVEIFGENSTEAIKLKTQLLNAQNAEEKIKQEVNKCNKELEEQKRASDKVEKSLDDVEDSAKNASDSFTVMQGVAANLISAGLSKIVDAAGKVVESFNEVDEGADNVVKATGATGESAEALTASFENVASKIVGGFDDIGSTLGEVNTRFGYTGEKLESCTEDFLKFSEITGVDSTKAVQSVSRALNDAEIPLDEYGTLLDQLAKAGQTAGIDVTALAGSLSENGAVMRSMGFDTAETVALLSQFEISGANSSVMLGGMKKAMSNWAKEGKNGNTEFASLVEGVKNGSVSASDAIDVFGTKAGPMLVDAIKSGKFEYNDMLKTIKNSKGTTDNTFDELIDGGYESELATQNAKLAFAEIGDTVLTTVSPAFDDITDAIKAMADGFSAAVKWGKENKGVLIAIGSAIGVVAAAITAYNVVQAVKAAMDAANVTTVWALVSAHIAQAAAALAAVAPYIAIAAAIAAVIAVIVLCVKNWDKIKAKIIEVAKKVKEKVLEIKNQITEKLNAAKQKAVEIFENLKKSISDKVTAVKEKIVSIFNKVLDFFKNNWKSLLLLVVNPFAGAFKLAYDNCEGFRNKVNGFISKIKNLFKQGFEFVKEKIITPIKNAKSKAVSTIESLRSSFSSKITSIKDKVTSVFSSLKDKLTKPIEQARTTIKNTVDKIKKVFNFSWSLPKLKIPKISVTGGKAPFGIGGMGSLPKFSITWNKEGAIFKKPTIFNTRAGLQGAGEAGAEAILPIDKLKDYIADTVEDKMNIVNLGALAASIERLADRPIDLNVNGRKFATATAGDSDRVNGLRSSFLSRDLVLD